VNRESRAFARLIGFVGLAAAERLLAAEQLLGRPILTDAAQRRPVDPPDLVAAIAAVTGWDRGMGSRAGVGGPASAASGGRLTASDDTTERAAQAFDFDGVAEVGGPLALGRPRVLAELAAVVDANHGRPVAPVALVVAIDLMAGILWAAVGREGARRAAGLPEPAGPIQGTVKL
jgi:hypothetical protein